MWRWKSHDAGTGSATLLLARVGNMHAVADALPPEALTRLLASVLRVCEDALGADGHLVTWDASAMEGSTVVCAWLDGPKTAATDFRGIARATLSGIRHALDDGLPSPAPPTQVIVAVCRGPCVFARKHGRITWALGATASRLYALARSRPDATDVILVDDATLGAVSDERGATS